MTEIFLLAPGPSANKETAEKIKATGCKLGVVTSAFDLAPWADFIISADREWWRKNPQAMRANARKFCASELRDTERIKYAAGSNSGVLALEVCKLIKAETVYLFGFDLRGSHFFGPYTNGLKNTSEVRRKIHIIQFNDWARSNKKIKVYNCTKGSALTCFEFKDYEF
jgi:hypothetical protein